MLSAEEIKSYLSDNIQVFTYDIIDSTNNAAKAMLKEGLSSNAVFAADEQTGGRGRQGKSFYSPKGTGLYMSVALCGKNVSDSLFITTAASVLVSQAIEEISGVKASIKWVNDLYLADKKVCGILTEAVRDTNGSLIGIVVGVGINLNTTVFPDELKPVAASVGQSIDRNLLASKIADKLISYNGENFISEYKKRSMVIGKDITYYINNIPYYGTAVDIDNKGGLVVNSDGRTITLDSGEITLRLQ